MAVNRAILLALIITLSAPIVVSEETGNANQDSNDSNGTVSVQASQAESADANTADTNNATQDLNLAIQEPDDNSLAEPDAAVAGTSATPDGNALQGEAPPEQAPDAQANDSNTTIPDTGTAGQAGEQAENQEEPVQAESGVEDTNTLAEEPQPETVAEEATGDTVNANSGIADANITADAPGQSLLEGILEQVQQLVDDIVRRLEEIIKPRQENGEGFVLKQSRVNVDGRIATCFGVKCAELTPLTEEELLKQADFENPETSFDANIKVGEQDLNLSIDVNLSVIISKAAEDANTMAGESETGNPEEGTTSGSSTGDEAGESEEADAEGSAEAGAEQPTGGNNVESGEAEETGEAGESEAANSTVAGENAGNNEAQDNTGSGEGAGQVDNGGATGA